MPDLVVTPAILTGRLVGTADTVCPLRVVELRGCQRHTRRHDHKKQAGRRQREP